LIFKPKDSGIKRNSTCNKITPERPVLHKVNMSL
jgi:hypothetical protein